MAWFGNARHPARNPDCPDATGSNPCAVTALVHGPSRQAVQLAASLGLAVNTASPMSRGSRVWGGDAGFGVHRFSGRLPIDPASPVAGAVAPVSGPRGVRYGMGVGPSQGQGASFPSTGTAADAGGQALAAISMGQLGYMGYGS